MGALFRSTTRDAPVDAKTVRRNAVRVSVDASLLIGALGVILWATGRAFVFPSLGPTAFVLALRPGRYCAREVIGGHLCGVLGGLLAYFLVANGLVLTDMPPARSWAAVRLAGSGALSVALTAVGMIGTRTVHAPACATTLIVSLGVLTTLLDAAIIMVSVGILYGLYEATPSPSRTVTD